MLIYLYVANNLALLSRSKCECCWHQAGGHCESHSKSRRKYPDITQLIKNNNLYTLVFGPIDNSYTLVTVVTEDYIATGSRGFDPWHFQKPKLTPRLLPQVSVFLKMRCIPAEKNSTDSMKWVEALISVLFFLFT